MYGRMQEEGRIESFNVVLLEPNAGMGGYIEVRGSAEQIAAVRASDEFLKSMLDAELIVHGMRAIEGYTDTGIARVMEMYQEALSAVPQPA
jgi:hypothetical protein